jgi:hypothetical protein
MENNVHDLQLEADIMAVPFFSFSKRKEHRNGHKIPFLKREET